MASTVELRSRNNNQHTAMAGAQQAAPGATKQKATGLLKAVPAAHPDQAQQLRGLFIRPQLAVCSGALVRVHHCRQKEKTTTEVSGRRQGCVSTCTQNESRACGIERLPRHISCIALLQPSQSPVSSPPSSLSPSADCFLVSVQYFLRSAFWLHGSEK